MELKNILVMFAHSTALMAGSGRHDEGVGSCGPGTLRLHSGQASPGWQGWLQADPRIREDDEEREASRGGGNSHGLTDSRVSACSTGSYL